jgi:two-component system sensor histidine kinase UhpB
MAKANETIHRYEALSSATNDAIWDYDMKTEKVTYNKRLIDIFGYSSEELENNTNWWQNNIHPNDKENVITRVNTLLSGNTNTWEDEYQFRCKNGDYKIVYDRSYIVRDNNNKPIRLIGAMKDVTHLRALEKGLFEEQLSQKNLLGKNIIISHENERKKIRHELHEDVNQILAAIKFYISKNKSENEHISTSLSFLDDAIVKIRKISNTLYSSTFELFGLKEAIEEIISIHQKESNVDIRFNSKNFSEHKLDKSISLHLYRILEDRISNILQFLKTDCINIVLQNSGELISLTIDFQSHDKNVLEVLNDFSKTDINGKLEMFESKMKLHRLENNYYTIVVEM